MVKRPFYPKKKRKGNKELTKPLFPELAERERKQEAAMRIEAMKKRLRTQLKFPNSRIPVKECARIMAVRINSRAGRMLLLELQGPLNLERHKVESIAGEADRVKRAIGKKRLTEAQAREFLAHVKEFSKFI